MTKAAQTYQYCPDEACPGSSRCICCGDVEDEHMGGKAVGSDASDAHVLKQQLSASKCSDICRSNPSRWTSPFLTFLLPSGSFSLHQRCEGSSEQRTWARQGHEQTSLGREPPAHVEAEDFRHLKHGVKEPLAQMLLT